MHNRYPLISLLLLALLPGLAFAARDPLLPAPEEIRREVARPNLDPLGHPLPLVAHFLPGWGGETSAFSPAWQMQMIDQGHFLLPWLAFPPGDAKLDAKFWCAYFEGPLAKAKALKLPITFICPQWDLIFTYDNYRKLPLEQTPAVINLDGKAVPQVDAFGPPAVWREAGQRYMSSPWMKRVQEIYPDPPAVYFVTMSGYSRFGWPEADKNKRYLDKYGKGHDDNFKRRVVADAWLAEGQAMQEGMREAFAQPAWKKHSVFVTYGAFGPPHFARPTDWSDFRPDGDWKDYSAYIPGRIDPSPLGEGGTAQYYAYDFSTITDYTVMSPQVESMNWVFMKAEGYHLNPKFWLEMATWDGRYGPNDKIKNRYEKQGQAYPPERYAGTMQFGMWVLRPRVVRQWQGWINGLPLAEGSTYFLPFVTAVDRVHTNPILRAFWRTGDLVVNPAHQHPYQLNVPPEYAKVDRWFLLDTSLDPPRPWVMTTELPVFALALAQGRAPHRQWLVYAHAPLSARQAVQIILPGYGPITVDVAVGGSYYLVDERTKKVTTVE